jgi:hypothetical protein
MQENHQFAEQLRQRSTVVRLAEVGVAESERHLAECVANSEVRGLEWSHPIHVVSFGASFPDTLHNPIQ